MTQANKICQRVSRLPISLEFSKRANMMNIYFPLSVSSVVTTSAAIVIPAQCCNALMRPVLTIMKLYFTLIVSALIMGVVFGMSPNKSIPACGGAKSPTLGIIIGKKVKSNVAKFALCLAQWFTSRNWFALFGFTKMPIPFRCVRKGLTPLGQSPTLHRTIQTETFVRPNFKRIIAGWTYFPQPRAAALPHTGIRAIYLFLSGWVNIKALTALNTDFDRALLRLSHYSNYSIGALQ